LRLADLEFGAIAYVWVVEEVNHSWFVSSSLETSITIRGVLGY